MTWVALVFFVDAFGQPATFRWPEPPTADRAECLARLERAVHAVENAGLAVVNGACLHERPTRR